MTKEKSMFKYIYYLKVNICTCFQFTNVNDIKIKLKKTKK